MNLRNSILWGTPVWCDDKPPDHLNIIAERCELVTNLTVQMKQAVPAERLSLRFHRCLIQSFGNVLQVPVSQAELKKIISWDGLQNLIFVQRNLVLAQDGGLKSLDNWLAFSPETIKEGESYFTHRIATRFMPKVFAQVIEGGEPLRVKVRPEWFPEGKILPQVGPGESWVGPFGK